MNLSEAVQLAREALTRNSDGSSSLDQGCLEVAALERSREGRKFRRLEVAEVKGVLGA